MMTITKPYRHFLLQRPLLCSTAITMLCASFFLLPASIKPTTQQLTNIGIGLPGYRLSAGPIIIPNVKVNASDLTFSSSTGTLFLITNNPTEVHELSLAGEHLRRITLSGFNDTEGIVHMEAEKFAIAEERRNNIAIVTIKPQTRIIKHADADIFTIDKARPKDNKGLEGVAYNPQSRQLIMVKEKSPRAILRVRTEHGSAGIDRRELSPWEWWKMRDLSAVQYIDATKNLLMLSDESQRIEERSNEGQLIASLNLGSGHAGLLESVPQAEGLALLPDGTLYVCSEPNLLYVFKKSRKPSTGKYL